MKVAYNWLKDFVEVKISPQALAEKLTMAGLEVTSLEERGGDFVFEIEVTSNRPDWLSVIGIAREAAAITGRKLKLPHAARRTPHAARCTQKAWSAKPFGIKIEDKRDCPLYTAKIIKDVKVGPSPEWLRKRLESIGCRSINNVVDITNYILFEWGEPLHAFDLDKLVSPLAGYSVNPWKIIIRRAKNREEIITIDGIKRVLDEEILVIASEVNEPKNLRTKEPTNKPVAIAGIAGGKETEVTETTKNILLEAAVFNLVLIRRARQKLGIQTDSSYRFERGIDLGIVQSASARAQELIQEIAGGSCVLAKAAGLVKPEKKAVSLNAGIVSKTLGLKISAAKIKQTLSALGFKAKPDNKNWRVAIPSFRQDVNSEIDLIEEVARIAGYAHIPKRVPAVRPQISAVDIGDTTALTKNILAGLGLNEVITYSLIDKNLLQAFNRDTSNCVEILNPLSREQEVLRPTLIPSLCRAVAYNLNQRQDYLNIFEIAKAFSAAPGAGNNPGTAPKEELVLGIALCGTKSWLLEQGLIKDPAGLLHLKGILEALFERLGVRDYNFKSPDTPCEINVYVNKEKIGGMVRLRERVLAGLDIKNRDVFAAEISLDKLLPNIKLKRRFMPLPVYPGISRDISFVLKEEISAEDILEAIRQEAKAAALLKEARVADHYRGKQIPCGYKGLTVSCCYRADERTLTEAEINPVHSLICEAIKSRFGADMR